MARIRLSSGARNTPNTNNGGILGSGIFGMIGTVNTCSATDDTIYCQLARYFSFTIMVSVLVTIVYLIYTLLIVPYVLKRKWS